MVSAISLMEIIMFKKIVEIYRVIMDLRYNPLRFIPDPILQGYLLMALFVMWCLFFGLIAFYHLVWFGYRLFVKRWLVWFGRADDGFLGHGPYP